MGRALLLVDPQCDFINGALPVPGATQAMNELAAFIRKSHWDLAIITIDAHPWAQCSFESHGGKWPRHCVAHTPGAAIWPEIFSALQDAASRVVILRKGVDNGHDQYSIFEDISASLALQKLFREYHIDNVDICGLAGDICLLNTLRDGVSLFGPSLFTVWQRFSPSLDGGKNLAEFCASEMICIK